MANVGVAVVVLGLAAWAADPYGDRAPAPPGGSAVTQSCKPADAIAGKLRAGST
jgi:hypothetical protein